MMGTVIMVVLVSLDATGRQRYGHGDREQGKNILRHGGTPCARGLAKHAPSPTSDVRDARGARGTRSRALARRIVCGSCRRPPAREVVWRVRHGRRVKGRDRPGPGGAPSARATGAE